MRFYFITGSSKGIGLAIVKKLLENNENYVIGFSRNNELTHDRFKHISVDLSDINNLKDRGEEYFEVDQEPKQVTLINNAGTLGEVGYLGELSSKSLPDIYNLNLIAPALFINSFIKKFKDSAAEVLIVNISSGAGSYPVDGWSGYCTTKAALNMLSKVVASEQNIRRSRVKIFSLAPGIVDTGMQEKIRNVDAVQFSGVEKFIRYKEDSQLASSENVAVKIMDLLEHPAKFEDVMQDVRNF